jgi:hypothetical protein
MRHDDKRRFRRPRELGVGVWPVAFASIGLVKLAKHLSHVAAFPYARDIAASGGGLDPGQMK